MKTKVKAYLKYKDGSSIIDMTLRGDLSKKEIIEELKLYGEQKEIMWIKKNGEYILGSPSTSNK